MTETEKNVGVLVFLEFSEKRTKVLMRHQSGVPFSTRQIATFSSPIQTKYGLDFRHLL
jgi:hypothetical protein